MFRICIAALRFSRLQSKVQSSVSCKEHAGKDQYVIPLPTHFRMVAPPPQSPLHKQASGCGRSKPPPPPVVGSGKSRL